MCQNSLKFCFQIKLFLWNSLFSQELVPLPLEEGTLTAAGDEHVEFQVPGLDYVKMENAGEFVFICLKGKEGSRYFQGMISEKNPSGLLNKQLTKLGFKFVCQTL